MKRLLGFLLSTLAEITIISILVLFAVYIIYDIAALFNINFILSLPEYIMFGLFLISRIFLMRSPKREEIAKLWENRNKIKDNDDEWVKFGLFLLRQVIFCIQLLGLWFTSYVVYYFWVVG